MFLCEGTLSPTHQSPLPQELSSIALDGKVIDVSDEFFAEAKNLIKVEVIMEHVPSAVAD